MPRYGDVSERVGVGAESDRTRACRDSRCKGASVTDTAERAAEIRQTDGIVLRFAGDSGDGMQLTGDRFTSASALFGNDLATLPNFPAEIRAPAGTLPGVSSFQGHISQTTDITHSWGCT